MTKINHVIDVSLSAVEGLANPTLKGISTALNVTFLFLSYEHWKNELKINFSTRLKWAKPPL